MGKDSASVNGWDTIGFADASTETITVVPVPETRHIELCSDQTEHWALLVHGTYDMRKRSRPRRSRRVERVVYVVAFGVVNTAMLLIIELASSGQVHTLQR